MALHQDLDKMRQLFEELERIQRLAEGHRVECVSKTQRIAYVNFLPSFFAIIFVFFLV